LGERPDPDEYLRRYPQWRERLARILQIHQLVGTQQQLADETPDDGVLSDPLQVDVPAAREVGGYELLEEIARGGMGVVYKARQVSLNRVVALKMILAGEFASAEQRQRFRREAELAARLQHPNIVQVFEVGQEDGRPYLAMEYVPGISLDRQLALGHFQRAGVTPGHAAQFVETLARAVHFAHQNGVVHRDLKPANVLLSDAGERQSTDVYEPMAVPKITDFGLAKALDETSERTGSGEFVGTPCYMAPEQATGGGVVGPAADIYALGAILYELIAGRPPLQGATLADTLRLLRDTEPLPPKQRHMRVPRDLATICLKCLSKDPARRYASAEALADDLHRFRSGEPIQARPVSRLERARKWARRRPAVAALLAALVFVTIGGAFLFVGEWRKAQRQIEATAAEHRIAEARSLWASDRIDEAKQVLDGCPLAFRNSDWHELYRACHAEILRLSPDVKVHWVDWTADDQFVVSTGGDHALMWEANTGKPLPSITWNSPNQCLKIRASDREPAIYALFLDRSYSSRETYQNRLILERLDLTTRQIATCCTVTVPAMSYSFAVVSLDGRRIAFSERYSGTSRGIAIFDVAAARKVMEFGRVDELAVCGLYFSPDGQFLARTFRKPDSSLEVWNTENGALISSTPTKSSGRQVPQARFSPDKQMIVFSAPTERVLTVFETATLKSLHSFQIDDDMQQPNATFSPDSRWMVCVGDKGQILVYETAAWEKILTLRGHSGRVSDLRFSRNGRYLASCGSDDTIRIWDIHATIDE
jgi:serine/threonine protein kinase